MAESISKTIRVFNCVARMADGKEWRDVCSEVGTVPLTSLHPILKILSAKERGFPPPPPYIAKNPKRMSAGITDAELRDFIAYVEEHPDVLMLNRDGGTEACWSQQKCSGMYALTADIQKWLKWITPKRERVPRVFGFFGLNSFTFADLKCCHYRYTTNSEDLGENGFSVWELHDEHLSSGSPL